MHSRTPLHLLPHQSKPVRIHFRYALAVASLILATGLLAGCLGNIPQQPALPTPTVVTVATAAPPLAEIAASTRVPITQPQPTGTATPDPALPLLGHKIGLDPGHGPGGDLGAVLVDPNTHKLVLSEAELNLDVAKRLRDILMARGASVVMTRETPDTYTVPWPPDTNGDGQEGTQTDNLQQRIDIFNAAHVEAFMSIHSNSAAAPANRGGIQAFYCSTDDCPFEAQDKRLASLALSHLASKLEQVGVTVKRNQLKSDFWSDAPGSPPTHLFMLGPANPPHHPRTIQMPGTVVEALYVTSPAEAAQLKQDNVRQAIAEAYADAFQEYFTTSDQ